MQDLNRSCPRGNKYYAARLEDDSTYAHLFTMNPHPPPLNSHVLNGMKYK